jgi:O-methyltransferase
MENTKKPISPEEYLKNNLGPVSGDAKELYLDLMKRVITNIIYEDRPLWYYDGKQLPGKVFSLKNRVIGYDIPTLAHTMVGLKRLGNIQYCMEQVLTNKIKGDFLEAGVYRGGCCIFMRAVLMAYGITDRQVFACDTFLPPQPLPPKIILFLLSMIFSIPSMKWKRILLMLLQRLSISGELKSFNITKNASDETVNFFATLLRYAYLTVDYRACTSLDDVKSHFARYGLLDEQVVFLKGFFTDTLPTAPINKLALIRLDGDLYESTIDALNSLYPKLSIGGYCIIDDYYAFADCKRAVTEYREKYHISDEIISCDDKAAYWVKTT